MAVQLRAHYLNLAPILDGILIICIGALGRGRRALTLACFLVGFAQAQAILAPPGCALFDVFPPSPSTKGAFVDLKCFDVTDNNSAYENASLLIAGSYYHGRCHWSKRWRRSWLWEDLLDPAILPAPHTTTTTINSDTNCTSSSTNTDVRQECACV